MSRTSVRVCGLGGASALGCGIAAQMSAMTGAHCPLRPLAGHPEAAGIYPDLRAGWIEDRSWLAGRKYGGASNAAVRAARMAVADAGWSAAEVQACHVFCGTSRGNTGELLGAWQARRPMRRLSASNSLHSETASAVSLHFMKPFTGHSLGASGAIDAVLLCAFLRQQQLPPNLPGMTTADPQRFPAPDTPQPLDPSSCLLKIASGMGGRNTIIAFAL